MTRGKESGRGSGKGREADGEGGLEAGEWGGGCPFRRGGGGSQGGGEGGGCRGEGVGSGQGAVDVGGASVDPGLFHTEGHGEVFVGGPAAGADYLRGVDAVIAVGVDDDQVGAVVGADEAAAVNVVEACGIAAHLFDDGLVGEVAAAGKLEHHREGELHGGHPGGCRQGVSCLLGEEMGGMVGGDDVDPAIPDGVQEGFPVVIGLDCGVAFGKSAGGLHGGFVEDQIMGAGFGGNPFFHHLAPGEETEFVGGGDVHHVEPGVGAARQFDGVAGGGDAGFA